MRTVCETFTAAEAALAAGISVKDLNRAVDEQILPEYLYTTGSSRQFKMEACLLIAFYYETADTLTAQTRLRMIRNRLVHSPTWEGWRAWSIEEASLTVHFDSLWGAVDSRIRDLVDARAMVVEDPYILGGTPVVRGTRVPVYQVAAAVAAGTPTDRILRDYPSLTMRNIELAAVYASAVPPRGRPRKLVLPPGTRLVSVTKRSLLRQQRGGLLHETADR